MLSRTGRPQSTATDSRFIEYQAVFMMFSSSNNPTALSYGFVKDYIVKPLTQQKFQRIIDEHLS